MATVPRPRCAKRVFSGDRGDMGGHLCGHYAVEGSTFCHIHTPTNDDPRRDTDMAPVVTSSRSTTYYASLAWKAGEGPVVAPPYRSGYGFITKVLAKATDGGHVTLSAVGVMRLKDGTPGIQRWDASWQVDKVVPAPWLAQLHALLDQERTR